MTDPTTPLLLQNIRVTAMLLAQETSQMGDPELSRMTDQMLGHFKEVVQYITTQSAGEPAPAIAVDAQQSTERARVPEPEPEPEPVAQGEPASEDAGAPLSRLQSITGATEAIGRAALELSNGDLSRAVEMVLTGDSALAAAADASAGPGAGADAQAAAKSIVQATRGAQGWPAEIQVWLQQCLAKPDGMEEMITKIVNSPFTKETLGKSDAFKAEVAVALRASDFAEVVRSVFPTPGQPAEDAPVAELELQPLLDALARAGLDEPVLKPTISEHVQTGSAQLQASEWEEGYRTFSALIKLVDELISELAAQASSAEGTAGASSERTLELRQQGVQALLVCNLRRRNPLASIQYKRVHGELRSDSVTDNIPWLDLEDLCDGVTAQHEVTDAAWRAAFPAAMDAVDDVMSAVFGKLDAFIGDDTENSSKSHWSQLREHALAAEAAECRFIRTSSWTLVARTAPAKTSSKEAWVGDSGLDLVRASTTLSSTPAHVSGSNDSANLARPTRRLMLPLVEDAMSTLTNAERPFVDVKQVDGGLLVEKQHDLVLGRESPPAALSSPEQAETDMQRAMELSMSSLDDAPPSASAASESNSGSGASSDASPAVLAQLRVASGRGGRCGHHALHNAILGATVATMPGATACPAAKTFLGDMLRDVAFWSRYHEHVAMIKSEAQRREVDVVSIAQGRSTWAADLPKPGA